MKGNEGPILMTLYINSPPSRSSSGLNIAAGTFKDSRYNSKNMLLTFTYFISITESFGAFYFDKTNIF